MPEGPSIIILKEAVQEFKGKNCKGKIQEENSRSSANALSYNCFYLIKNSQCFFLQFALFLLRSEPVCQ